MNFRTRLQLVALFTALSSTLSAEIQQPEGAEETKRGFRTLGWHLSADDLFYEANEKEISLKIHDSARSAYFKPPTGKILTAYRKVTDDRGRIVKEVVARADMSKGGKTPIVIFSNDSKNKGKYQCATFRDDATSFPPASFRFINLSSVNLKAGLASKSVIVPAKGQALIKENPDKKSPTRFVSITAMIDGKPQRLYSNNWVLRPVQRTMVIISAVGGNAEVTRIVDVPDPL